MRKFLVMLLAGLFFAAANAQPITENLVIITFDGLRWQELFGGADEVLISDKSFNADTAETKKKFWAATPEERRKILLPFIWDTVAKHGQLHGNRHSGNFVNVRNPYRISYPGYNEIFTGYPDSLIASNDKKENRNVTVLEFLNNQPSMNGRIAAFASWDVFNFIFNKKTCGFPVNAGIDPVNLNSPRFTLLNEMQKTTFQPFGKGIRPDLLTYYLAKEYLLVKKPRVLYIGFDDTDDWAHNGKYDYYLEAAKQTDSFLHDLWNTMQGMPEYKNKTTFLIATDHGRGDKVKKEWRDHGKKIKGADEIWLAFLGDGIPAKGEVKKAAQLYQSGIAQTIAQFLGFTFTALHPVDKYLELITTD